MGYQFYCKILLLCAIAASMSLYFVRVSTEQTQDSVAVSMQQLDPHADQNQVEQDLTRRKLRRDNLPLLCWALFFVFTIGLLFGDLKTMCKRLCVLLLLVPCLSGCRRPFEPNDLQVIKSTEEAFLLPFKGDTKSQTSSHTEEYLKSNLVYTQQIRIPQQWVARGYETIFPDGEWQPAAMLIRVDKSPVTREWTADPNSGTSSKNEAVWVMTSDQVEFSTGWTCTARIASREDAVKFLYNYPNGSIEKVMDSEVRAKLQAEFGLEVTDLPMEELRKQSTPHIIKVTKAVTVFFAQRGITITNLGITGGYIYKDPSVLKTMVEVFNTEQRKVIEVANTAKQAEQNKQEQLKSEAKAKAVMTAAKAEADAIKLVADAKKYEIEQAKNNESVYLALKHLELEKQKMEKWNGRFPDYFMGGTDHLNMLLQVPAPPLSTTK